MQNWLLLIFLSPVFFTDATALARRLIPILVLFFIVAAAPSAHATDTAPGGGAAATTSPGCDARPDTLAEHERQRRVNVAQQSTIIQRTVGGLDVKAAYDLQCIDRLVSLVGTLFAQSETIKTSFYPMLTKMIAIAAANILAALLNQFIDNIVNAVCSASNQILGAIEHRLQNAICIPPTKGIDPFNFQIDIEAVKCSGWSVDLLNGSIIGNPVEGLSGADMNNLLGQARQAQSTNTNASTSTSVGSSHSTGFGALVGAPPNGSPGSSSSSGQVPPPIVGSRP